MSDIVSVVASSTGFANSGAGKLWTPGGPTYLTCPLGQADSSAIAGWLVSGSGNPIPPDQLLQGIRFSGQHAYTVDVGGADKTRLCTAKGGVGFGIGATPFGFLGTVRGTGTGESMLISIDPSSIGITSTHYNNDQIYITISATTDAADSFYSGLYRFEALNWTLYFGIPPPTSSNAPVGHFDNPIGNTSPGKIAGVEQFASVQFTIDQPAVGSMSWQWVLKASSGMLFSNGTRFLNQTMGASNAIPGNINSCGAITIPAGLAPGQYPLTMNVTGMTAPASPNSLTMTTYLTVRRIASMFMEA